MPTSPAQIGLYGLSQNYYEGNGEPPLDWVVETLGYNIDVGGTGLIINPSAPTTPNAIGDEVLVPLFEKAGNGVVTILPVARYSPNESLPFGWYTWDGSNDPVLNQVDAINLGQFQTLLPTTQGGNTSFDPGTAHFGIYVDSNSFNRVNYTEDELNTDNVDHRARIYPLNNRQGQVLANTYMVTYEDASNGDYQDYVFVLTNVTPAVDEPQVPFAPTGMTVGGTLNANPAVPNYSWNYEAGVEWYEISISNALGYSTQAWYQVGVDVTCNVSTCTFNPAVTVPNNGDYTWMMRAYNAQGYWGRGLMPIFQRQCARTSTAEWIECQR